MASNAQMIQVKGFKGLNTHAFEEIPNNQFQNLFNFAVDEVGILRPRAGIRFEDMDPVTSVIPPAPSTPDGTFSIVWIPPHNPYDPSVTQLPTNRKSGAPSSFVHALVNGKLYYSLTSPPSVLRAYEYQGDEIQIDDFHISGNSLYVQGSAGLSLNKLFRVWDNENVDIVQENLNNVADILLDPATIYHKGRHWNLDVATDDVSPDPGAFWGSAIWDLDVWQAAVGPGDEATFPSSNLHFSEPIDFQDYSTYYNEEPLESPVAVPDEFGYPLKLIPYRNQLIILCTGAVLQLYADSTPDRWNIEVLFDGVHMSSGYVHNDILYLVGREGVFVSDGNQMQKLSAALDHEFQTYDWVYGEWPTDSPGSNLVLFNPYSQPQIFAYGNYIYVTLWTSDYVRKTTDDPPLEHIWQSTRKMFIYNIVSQSWSRWGNPIDPVGLFSISTVDNKLRTLSLTFMPPEAGFVRQDGQPPTQGMYFNFVGQTAEDFGLYFMPFHGLDHNFDSADRDYVIDDYLDFGTTPYDCTFLTKEYSMDKPAVYKRGMWGGLWTENLTSGNYSLNGTIRSFQKVGYSKFPVPKRFREASLTFSYQPHQASLMGLHGITGYEWVFMDKSKVHS